LSKTFEQWRDQIQDLYRGLDAVATVAPHAVEERVTKLTGRLKRLAGELESAGTLPMPCEDELRRSPGLWRSSRSEARLWPHRGSWTR
jgi:hypothetical protein